jgi:hypothetical protein
MSMNNRDKNLNELLGSLLGADEAGKCAEDIRRGDELLAKNPVPLPRPRLLADIKTQMLLAHYRKRHTHRLHYVYSSVAIAATFAVVCGLAWFYVAGTGTVVDLGLAMEPASIAPVSENIQSVSAQLDQIEDSVTALTAADTDLSSPAEYQTDIANLESSLWKG